MLVDFIDDLQATCAVDHASIIPAPVWLADYLRQAIVSKGLERLAQDRHATEMTAALFDNQRIVPLETHASGWSALLLTIDKEASSMSTAPGAALIHVLEAGGELTFSQCCVEGVASLDDIPTGARLGDRASFVVGAGDTFVVPRGMRAILLEGTSNGVKLLRFNGPVAAPISLAFDPATGRMVSSSFSGSEATGRHFFSILLGELTAAPSGPGSAAIPRDEHDLVADLIEDVWSEDVHAYTGWRLAQVLARVRPSAAVDRLENMSRSGLPNLGRHATAVLSRRSGAPA